MTSVLRCLLVALCFMVSVDAKAQSEDPARYVRRNTWQNTLVLSREDFIWRDAAQQESTAGTEYDMRELYLIYRAYPYRKGDGKDKPGHKVAARLCLFPPLSP